jgi:hypothetical protein
MIDTTYRVRCGAIAGGDFTSRSMAIAEAQKLANRERREATVTPHRFGVTTRASFFIDPQVTASVASVAT